MNGKQITIDEWVLNTVCGYSVGLMDLPKQKYAPLQIKFSDNETAQIETELQRFLECKNIERVYQRDQGEFISNIFTKPKKEGKIRENLTVPRGYFFCGSFMFFFCLVFAMPLCASVYMCLVVTCWERADLLALVCGV